MGCGKGEAGTRTLRIVRMLPFMVHRGDRPHLAAMQEMQKMMGSPNELAAWMEEKRRAFEALPDIA